MPKIKEIRYNKREQVVERRKNCETVRSIGNEFNIPHTTVQSIVTKFKEMDIFQTSMEEGAKRRLSNYESSKHECRVLRRNFVV